MTTATAPENSATKLWRVPNYAAWFASDTAHELTNSLTRFAMPLIALAVTGDPAQAGIIAAVGMAAGVVLTLVGGVLADRHRRTTLMFIGSLVGVVLCSAFAWLDVSGAFTFTALLALNVLMRMRDGLFDTSIETLVKDIVPADAMGRAQAANQGRGAVLQLLGGPLGGLLLSVGGWLIGLVAAIGQAIVAGAAVLLGRRVTQSRPEAEADGESFGRQLKSGLAWTLSRRDLRGVLIAATIVNLGFNAAITTLVYSLQQNGVSLAKIGLISAVSGAVMLLGSLIAPMLIGKIPAGTLIIGGLAISAIGMVALGAVESFGGILLVLAGSVLFIPAVNSALLGYFMVAVPSEMLGRASSALQVLAMAAMPFAPLIAGFGLAHFGRVTTLVAAGVICVVAAVVAFANRGIRSLPVEKLWSDHAQAFTAEPQVAEPSGTQS